MRRLASQKMIRDIQQVQDSKDGNRSKEAFDFELRTDNNVAFLAFGCQFVKMCNIPAICYSDVERACDWLQNVHANIFRFEGPAGPPPC